MEKVLISLAGCAVLLCFAWPFIKRGKASRFSAALMFAAGCALMVSVVGTWLDTLVGWIPAAVLGAIALGGLAVLGIGLFLDAKDGRVDKPGQWIAFTLPVFLFLLPGAMGAQTQSIVNEIGNASNGAVANVRTK